jgi:diphthine-ammonia ligase
LLTMRVAVLCSGGKDSAYALWLAMKQKHEVTGIVTMIPKREDSWMFHYPNIGLIDLFAKCADLPLIKAETSGVRELELEDLKRALSGLEADGVVNGAIASKYQKSRIDRICEELDLESMAPLWGMDPQKLLLDLIAEGFEAIVTSVSADGLDKSWLGRKIDEAAVQDLLRVNRRYKINVCGEGGEYESLVLDAPFFKRRIYPTDVEIAWRGTSGYLLIKSAQILEK